MRIQNGANDASRPSKPAASAASNSRCSGLVVWRRCSSRASIERQTLSMPSSVPYCTSQSCATIARRNRWLRAGISTVRLSKSLCAASENIRSGASGWSRAKFFAKKWSYSKSTPTPENRPSTGRIAALAARASGAVSAYESIQRCSTMPLAMGAAYALNGSPLTASPMKLPRRKSESHPLNTKCAK